MGSVLSGQQATYAIMLAQSQQRNQRTSPGDLVSLGSEGLIYTRKNSVFKHANVL